MSMMMEGEEATRKSKSTFVCEFCNAIVATKIGHKDAFVNHMEEAHNIQVNLNVVMAVHFLSEEEKEKLIRTKRGQLEHFFGLKVEIGEDEKAEEDQVEENLPSFKYPKLEAKPNEKESDFLRRRLSVYLNIQGFGRGGVQYGQGRAPFGWPSKKYSWSSFKGTARGCPLTMAQDVVDAMLNAQGINPLDLIDEDPSKACSDLDGDSDSAEPSLAAEKSKEKNELLKKLKSALGALGEQNLERSTQLSQRRKEKPLVPTTSTIQEFRNALELCLPKNSSMTTAEIQSKMESDIFPMSVIVKCLQILANEGLINWANLVVSWQADEENVEKLMEQKSNCVNQAKKQKTALEEGGQRTKSKRVKKIPQKLLE